MAVGIAHVGEGQDVAAAGAIHGVGLDQPVAGLGAVGPGVARVGGAFVEHFEDVRGQPLGEGLVHLLGDGKVDHGNPLAQAAGSSPLRCGAM